MVSDSGQCHPALKPTKPTKPTITPADTTRLATVCHRFMWMSKRSRKGFFTGSVADGGSGDAFDAPEAIPPVRPSGGFFARRAWLRRWLGFQPRRWLSRRIWTRRTGIGAFPPAHHAGRLTGDDRDRPHWPASARLGVVLQQATNRIFIPAACRYLGIDFPCTFAHIR